MADMDLERSWEKDRVAIEEHENKILANLYGISETAEIIPGIFGEERSWQRDDRKKHLIVHGSVEDRNYVFVASYYPSSSERFKGVIPPAQKTYEGYRLLAKAGVQVPKLYVSDKLPEWVFSRYMRSPNLGKFLAKLSPGDKKRELEKIVESLANVQHDTTLVAKELSQEDRNAILWSRGIREQITDYLRICFGKPQEELPEGLVDDCLELIEVPFEFRCVIHGDFGDKQVLVREDQDDVHLRYIYLDPELKERGFYHDLGNLSANMGSYSPRWYELAEQFKIINSKLFSESEGIKSRIRGLDGEGRQKSHRAFMGAALHSYLRKWAKVLTFPNSEYNGTPTPQQRGVYSILKDVIEKPDFFGVSSHLKERAERAKDELSRVMIQEALPTQFGEYNSEEKPKINGTEARTKSQ